MSSSNGIGLGYTAEVLGMYPVSGLLSGTADIIADTPYLMENPWSSGCGYHVLVVTCSYLAGCHVLKRYIEVQFQ